ncbi:hypothetical protein EDB83DRAFT_2531489 [Lactarius deliciosus]|nr:hypothetical protein EDB83DRAFT_2531489 [Lactarius deliciosus]
MAKLYGGYVLRDPRVLRSSSSSAQRIESVAHLNAPNKHRQTLQTRRLGLCPFFKAIQVCAVVGYVTVEAGETGFTRRWCGRRAQSLAQEWAPRRTVVAFGSLTRMNPFFQVFGD